MLKKIFSKSSDPGYKPSKKMKIVCVIMYVMDNIIQVLAFIWVGPVLILRDEGSKSSPVLVFIISLAVILSIIFIAYTVYKQIKNNQF